VTYTWLKQRQLTKQLYNQPLLDNKSVNNGQWAFNPFKFWLKWCGIVTHKDKLQSLFLDEYELTVFDSL
jgi:hypothetical protein